jgi:hypothetical protein
MSLRSIRTFPRDWRGWTKVDWEGLCRFTREEVQKGGAGDDRQVGLFRSGQEVSH